MVRGELVCGAVTAGAFGLVLAALDEYQVHDFADMDPAYGLGGAIVAGVAAALINVGICRWRRLSTGHVLVPLLFLPLVIGPLVLGLERDRIDVAVLFGAVAFAVHLTIGRPAAALGIAATLVLAGALTWGSQQRWRAQKFEAVGVPLYVADVPGYRLREVWAGRWSVTQTLEAPGGGRLDVVITADRCRPGETGRWVALCLPDGDGAMKFVGTGNLAGVTVRKVDGWVLAGYPDGTSTFEPD